MPETVAVPRVPAEQFTLENGLRVILSEDHAVPVVSVAVYYDVGSRNEREGRTGFAHLFEHMMFQGSENVPKAAHFQYVFNSGGTMNGTTSTERTNYYETLPSHQFPLALWLESDRMRSLKVTQENLDNQRHAVQEEKRLTYDNRPYSGAFLRLNEMVFRNPANAHSTIGSMEDLDAASVEDVREFFRIYYAPNNAVLSIVGDFDPAEARSLVEKYFASIPRQPAPPVVNVDESAEVAARFESYPDRFAQLPALMLGWKAPVRRTPEFYALALASDLLLEGESSRLYQRLVKGDESVVAVQGGMGERRGPSSLYLFAIPKPGKTTDEIRATIMGEIDRLASEGATPGEMEKLRNNLLNDSVRGRQSTMFRAQMLAEYTLYDGDPDLINTELEHYLRVTPEEIKEAAARFLSSDNFSLIEVVPAPDDAETPTAGTAAPSTSAAETGGAEQPGAPPPQVPPRPPAQPPAPTGETPASPLAHDGPHPEKPAQPADAPQVKV
ncbi:MAG: insulinase family protein [Acidobacteria bacterium]|nr:insulinase family protein [Acidobacteriota bacterium]